MLAFELTIDKSYDLQTSHLPTIFPFKKNVYDEYCSHAVLSYRVQDASEVVELTEIGVSFCSVEGFDIEHRTLALSSLNDGSLVQVTSKSVRVLHRNGALMTEWLPPQSSQEPKQQINATTCSNFSRNITVAALNNEGILLAIIKDLYSLRVDTQGVYHVTGARYHHYEISSLAICNLRASNCLEKKEIKGNYQFISEEAATMVVVGEWISNTAALLTWPDLKGIAKIDCGCAAPIRSVVVADFEGLQCLFLGNSAGVLYFFKLQMVECTEVKTQSRDTSNYSLEKVPNEQHESLLILTAATQNKDFFLIASHNKERIFKVILVDKRVFKVGSSEVLLLVGSFFGSQCPTVDTPTKSPSNYVLAQTNESAVLLFRNGETLGACGVRGACDVLTTMTRFHTEKYPFSLLAVSRSGQLLISHLDVTPKLCWDTIQLDGTPCHLAYDKLSNCAIVSCQGPETAQISFIQIQALQHVLTVELGEHCEPTLLGIISLPDYKNVSRPVNFLIVGSKVHSEILGSLSFLSYQNFSPGKQQMQYQASLILQHETEFPCLCHCMLSGDSKQTSQKSTSIQNEFMSRSSLWTAKSNDQSVLVVGGFGKVVLYLLSLRSVLSSENTLSHEWVMDLERAAEFSSPGKSYVTALAALSEDTLLVVEELYGVSIFHVHEAAVINPLTVHQFDSPVQAVCPLLNGYLLVAIYGEGIRLMQRNFNEELAYQVEKLEVEEMMEKRRAQESEYALPQDSVLGQEETEITITRLLPGLIPHASAKVPFTATKIFAGKLSISIGNHSSMIGESMSCKEEALVVITQFGEIGSLTLVYEY